MERSGQEAEGRIVINIGVVGYGYWGPNLVRNFAETSGAQSRRSRGPGHAKARSREAALPVVSTTTRFQDLLEDPGIDAIAIATPVNTHFELGMAVLRRASICGSRSRWRRLRCRRAS